MFRKTLIVILIVILWIIPYSFVSFSNNILWFNDFVLGILILLEIIILLFISTSVYKIIKNHSLNNNYLFILTINYLVNSMYAFFLFNFNSLFFSFISLVIIIISSTFLFIESEKIDRDSSIYLIPYMTFNFYLLITIIYLLIHYS